MKTKTFKPRVENLTIRDACLVLGPTLAVIKITKEQAMMFQQTTSFQNLIDKYGRENMLRENEFYHGYVVADYGFYQEVVYMHGKLIKETNYHNICNFNKRKACERGNLWDIVDTTLQIGKFKYVWTFMDSPFERASKELADKKLISSNISADNLKQKIVTAFIKNEHLTINEDEELVLKYCVNPYFKTFFIEL